MLLHRLPLVLYFGKVQIFSTDQCSRTWMLSYDFVYVLLHTFTKHRGCSWQSMQCSSPVWPRLMRKRLKHRRRRRQSRLGTKLSELKWIHPDVQILRLLQMQDTFLGSNKTWAPIMVTQIIWASAQIMKDPAITQEAASLEVCLELPRVQHPVRCTSGCAWNAMLCQGRQACQAKTVSLLCLRIAQSVIRFR